MARKLIINGGAIRPTGLLFSLLIIHVRHPHNDIQMGVELSPLSNFDKIEKSKMAAITIWTFIKNNISRKVIELETSFWCQTICF